MKSKNNLYKATEFNNIKEIIKNSVEKFPNNNAFIVKTKIEKQVKYTNITYTEFWNDICALGTKLIDMGLKEKRIAIISKNRYEWAVSYLATVCGTGIAIPLDKGLPEQEIELSLIKSKADVIVFSKEYIENIKNIKSNKKTNTKYFICMDETEEDDILILSKLLESGKKLLNEGNREFIDSKIDNEKMSIILFTSGTTSLAKAVMLSHKNIASNIYALNKAEKIYENDVNLAFLPLHHTFGSTGLILFLSNGSTNVFCDGLRHIQTNLKEYGVSVFVGVPLLLEAMHKKIIRQIKKNGKEKLVKISLVISKILLKIGIDIRRVLFKEVIEQLGGKIRFVVSGASGLDKKVAESFNSFGILAVQGYGLTETSPVLSAENKRYIKYGSIGFPLSNVDLKIDNQDEHGIGEIIAKGPNIMLGYYENKEATNEVLKEGWFHTGDLAYRDKKGYIFITGRKKNVIVLKNGKNVFPEELESIINNLEYVQESMVFGMPKDDDLVVSVKIVYDKDYVKNEYGKIEEKELESKIWKDIKQINSRLTNYKHIKNLIITDEPMIKTTTAKIKRQEELKKILESRR